MTCVIDDMKPQDWAQVRTIYRQGIGTGHSTFETDAPDWGKWDADHLPNLRFTARVDGSVRGWVALSRVSNRSVYAGIVEVSLYVALDYQGRGVGSTLLSAPIEASEKTGIWSLQAGIFPENQASLALFKKHDFREIGRREKAGKMTYGEQAGAWRDVVLLERRSAVAGVD
jgi:phosphinothricin acetyltransferase